MGGFFQWLEVLGRLRVTGHSKRASGLAQTPSRGGYDQRHHMVIRNPTMMMATAMARFHAPMFGIG